jgi:hypothetical protein
VGLEGHGDVTLIFLRDLNMPAQSMPEVRRVVSEEEALSNLKRIRDGFMQKGIPKRDIEAGRTVLSFNVALDGTHCSSR